MSAGKALLFGVQAVMKPIRVKTAATFTAEDPWNQKRSSSFKLNEYLLLFAGAAVTESTKATGTDFKRALVSEIDGVERWLPDSLSELWRTRQVPAEALPRLLKEAEPTLKNGDYTVVLRNKARWLLVALNTLVFLAFIAFMVVGFVSDEGQVLPKIGGVLLVAAISWLILYFSYYRTWFRRKRQMKWFLERAEAARKHL